MSCPNFSNCTFYHNPYRWEKSYGKEDCVLWKFADDFRKAILLNKVKNL